MASARDGLITVSSPVPLKRRIGKLLVILQITSVLQGKPRFPLFKSVVTALVAAPGNPPAPAVPPVPTPPAPVFVVVGLSVALEITSLLPLVTPLTILAS